MDATELIAYIEQEHMEAQLICTLLFNKIDFLFLPLSNPIISKDGPNYSIIIGDGYNVLGTEFQRPCFNIPDNAFSKGFDRLLHHPEHLHAYEIRSNNTISGKVLYEKKNSYKRTIRNCAFEEYIEQNKITNIEMLKRHFKDAESSQEEYIQSIDKKTVLSRLRDKREQLYDIDILLDDLVVASIKEYHLNQKVLFVLYAMRLNEIQNAMTREFYVSNNHWYTLGEKLVQGIAFTAELYCLKEVYTPLNQDVTIIDDRDQIPDILYKISTEIFANRLWIATGYAFESGLQLIQSAMTAVRVNDKEKDIELIIGDLYKYSEDKRQKSINRATAEKINWLIQAPVVSHVYTYPKRFYHGKFYYISNDKVTYVIVGSSNITETAYTRNRELDVMFRFVRGKDDYREQQFIDWFNRLKGECIPITYLKEDLFDSNLIVDESGTEQNSAFLKTLTSEEEKERYQYLKGFKPSKVVEDFSKRREFKAFSKYILFVYADYGIVLLEGFAYGNSCYIFSTSNIEKLENEIAHRSKEQVRRSDLFITSINHDEKYKEEIMNIFDVSKRNR